MLPVMRSVLVSLREVLHYRTSGLKKRFKLFDGHVASNVEKFVKGLSSQLKETEFDESDLIFLLAFMKERRDAYNSIGAHEGVDL